MNITNALKNSSREGQIKETVALRIGNTADSTIKELCELLSKVKTQVGMVYGEMIAETVSRIEGKRFDSKSFNFERLPEGQE